MEIKILNENDAAVLAAKKIVEQITRMPETTLGLATGSTPIKTYQELVKNSQNVGLDWGKVTTFNLDEYVGLDKEHEKSYHQFMKKNLFDDLMLEESQYHFPETEGDVEKNITQYEKDIKEAGEIDLQILGLGENGHIAFNEPGSSFSGRTSLVKLTDSTIEANSRFFKDKKDVPTTAMTVGIGTILDSKQIIILAFGKNKAEAVKEMVEGKYDTSWPCTSLQKHDNVLVLIDKDAASLLEGKYEEA